MNFQLTSEEKKKMSKELNIQRKTLTGATEAFSFSDASSNYMVKNFGSGDIYVAFVQDLTEAKAIKIPTGYGEVCSLNCMPGTHGPVSDTIYVKGSGEVEVRQV